MGDGALTREEHMTHTVNETISLGEAFATRMHPGSVIALRGGLGSGKTHFTKGIARYFGIDDHDISSPTFSLANEYPVSLADGREAILYHLDCYRFERPEELLELGVEEYLYPRNGMSVIEWAERIEEYLPADRIDISFETLSDSVRRITIVSHTA